MVFDSVGQATWKHSILSLKPGDAPSAEPTRVFFLPRIDRVLALKDAREGFRAMVEGDLFGKIVLTP